MNSIQFCVVDAGSTKTDVFFYDNGKITSKHICGYNPNRNDTNFVNEFNSIQLNPDVLIYFYGSGLKSEQAKIQLKKQLSNYKNLNVYSDILGSARALKGDNKGFIGILGTGAVFANYNGKEITETKGGYGYLIDDIGGGLELSKTIISHWLNNNFNDSTNKAIETYFDCQKTEFITTFYSHKNLTLLVGLCNNLPNLAKSDKQLNEVVLTYFNLAFYKHLLTFNTDVTEISLTGSIALHFEEWIRKSLNKNNINVTAIIDKPIKNLINFHLNHTIHP